MEYTIERVGQMALGIVSDGRERVEVSLLGAQSVPAEFKEGDRLRIVNYPDGLYKVGIVANNRGYYTLTHFRSGATLTVSHRADEWRLEAD
jgi:methyl coenzyme M reductase gamma subunit